MKILVIQILALLLLSNVRNGHIKKRALSEVVITSVEKVVNNKEILPPEFQCKREIMKNFGLRGVSFSVPTPHKYCPGITKNCCSPEDAEYQYETWNKDTRFKLERYYQMYSYAVKYLFGFTPEGFLLARKHSIQSNIDCKRLGNEYLSMNLNPGFTIQIMTTFINAMKKVMDIRRGFFCLLCEEIILNDFGDFDSTTNMEEWTSIYYSSSFCSQLVEDTIESAYFQYAYLQRYLNNIVGLMKCETGEKKGPSYDLTNFSLMSIKNCFFFRVKFFFFFCQSYCNNWNLVKVSPYFDGDLLGLQPFVTFFTQFRSSAFAYPRNNLFLDGVNYEENFLNDLYTETLRDNVFYRGNGIQSVYMDQWGSQVIAFGGTDLYPYVKQSKFLLSIQGSYVITRVIGAFFVMALSLF